MAKIDKAVIDAAQASETKHGIPASVSLAQYALESAWGKKMPAGSNNPFGIKAAGKQASVTVRTREVDKHGRTYYINAPFRKFASIAEAFDEHGRLLAQAKPYAHARALLPDPNAFADALTGVYATDPQYGALLKKIMQQSGLYQYNRHAIADIPLSATLAMPPAPPASAADAQAVADANKEQLAQMTPQVTMPVTIRTAALDISRATINEVLASAPPTVAEHIAATTKIKLGEKSTWVGFVLLAATLLADPTVQVAAHGFVQAFKSGSWGGVLSAAIGLGMILYRQRSTPSGSAMLAAQRLIQPAQDPQNLPCDGG